MYSSVYFSLAPCPVCGDFEPIAYLEGMAKNVFDGNGESKMYFTDVDGYIVECQECGARTKHHQILHDAISAWNNGWIIKEDD